MDSIRTGRMTLAGVHALAVAVIYAVVVSLPFKAVWAPPGPSALILAVLLALGLVFAGIIAFFWWLHRRRLPNAATGAIVGVEAALTLTIVFAAPFFLLMQVFPLFGDRMTSSMALGVIVMLHGKVALLIAVPIGALAAVFLGRRIDHPARHDALLLARAEAKARAEAEAFPMLKIGLAFAHAGAAASLYLLMRQIAGAWDRIDPTLIALVVGLTLFFWWRYRAENMDVHFAMRIGAQATLIGGLIVMIPVYLSWIGESSGHVPKLAQMFMLALAVLARLAVVALAVIPAGAAAGALYLLLAHKDGRFAAIAAIAMAVLANLLPATQGVARATLGLNVMDVYQRHEGDDRFALRIAVALNVRGTPVTLERVIVCEELHDAAELREVGARQRWLPRLKSFGQIMRDGSGVFVITPDLCAAYRPGLRRPPSAQAFVRPPLIGWTPSAATFDSIDLYVDGTAFDRQDAEVKFLDMTVDAASDADPISPPDAFAVIGWQGTMRNTDALYYATYGVAIGREEWSRDAAIAAHLEAVRGPAFVLEHARVGAGDGPKLSTPLAWLEQGLMVHLARDGQGIPPLPTRSLRGSEMPLPGQVFPIRRTGGGALMAFPEERGVVSFTRTTAHRYGAVMLGERKAAGTPGPYLYDPDTATLIQIATVRFSFALPQSAYASR